MNSSRIPRAVVADQLLTATLDLDAPDPATHQPGGHTKTNPAVRPRSCLPATLHLHVRNEDLLAHLNGETTRLGSAERLGPATLDLLADWLGRTDLTIHPVLDTTRTAAPDAADAVDRHDPPGWMRELVIQRDHHCVFPWCAHDARTCDLDHIDPYLPPDRGGPPGQTAPENLAPLCRRHHRCKTFTRWRYHRQPDGTYHWRDPHGTRYRVDPTTATTTRI